MVITFTVGVYSQYFANGGVHIFFLGLINVYVYALCVVSYPVLIELPVGENVDVENVGELAPNVEDHFELREVGVRHQEIEMFEVSGG